jgi:hypothetical protein
MCLSVRRTTSAEMASMTRRSTRLLASRGIVHRLRPSGVGCTPAPPRAPSAGQRVGGGCQDEAAQTGPPSPLVDTTFARALDGRPAGGEGDGADVVSCPSLRLQQNMDLGYFPGCDMLVFGERHSRRSFVVRSRDEILLGHEVSPLLRPYTAGRITPQNPCDGPLVHSHATFCASGVKRSQW